MGDSNANGSLSLRDVDPVEDLLARLRLDHVARKRGAVIVEGPSDVTVLASTTSLDRRALFPVNGRPNVLRCARSIGDSGLAGVICLADRDFDEHEDAWDGFWWLVFYDDADVEAMLVETEALDRFLEEWASKRKLERFGGVQAVRQRIRDQVQPLSALRTENLRSNLGLRFDELDLMALTEKDDGGIRTNSLVGRLASASRVPHDELEASLKGEVPACPHSGRPLAKGRDMLAVLGVLLRRAIGSLSKQQVDGRFVERSVRLSANRGDFDQTPFLDRLRAALAKATS